MTLRRAGAVALVALATASGARAQTAPAAGPPPPPTVFLIEQVRTNTLPDEVKAQIEPLHSLPEIEGVLKSHRMAFTWAVGEVRSATLPPALAKDLAGLPPREPFVAQMGQSTVIGVVIEKRPDTAPPPPPPPPATPAPTPAPKKR